MIIKKENKENNKKKDNKDVFLDKKNNIKKNKIQNLSKKVNIDLKKNMKCLSNNLDNKEKDIVKSKIINKKNKYKSIIKKLLKNKKNIQKKILYLKNKVNKYKLSYKDVLLRSQAELLNMRLRTDKEIKKAYDFSIEKFAFDLLPVVDNLERSIKSFEQKSINLESIKKGIELIIKSMIDTLHNFNIYEINKINVKFDPKIHQAMNIIESDQYDNNIVVKIIQTGYLLHKRLIRPAMVSVSRFKKS